ncbi:ABC transporter permease [Chelativorans sp. J32]|mgnify:CR=1 FL=1|uniref:ABC transporter permease n=1 Tax=Chelativorans sp. J32 TaxID=935840 RepID=UPI0004862393|nr:ABC transporter permease [Chelativorans sp. J32]
MWRYVLKRLLTAILTVMIAAVATFVMVRFAPGDPVLILIGEYATPEQIAAARAEFGLDRPLLEQLAIYVWKALRLDFGQSITQGIPVAQIVLGRMPETLLLATVTMVLIMLVSVPLGMMSAVRQDRPLDRVATGGSFVALSLPDFWVGIVLILVFARWLHLLPSAGFVGPSSIILPAVTLALPLAALNLRLMRNETLNVLNAPYITLARARGLSHRAVLRRHVLRNAIIPALTVMGVQFGKLLGGAAIVETVFGWPGLGELLVRSINGRDYPVVQGCIIVITVMVVTANLIVDIAYRRIDPRFRT